MGNPRSWKRREFNIAQAGYFTVLKPTGGISASRLPGGIQDFVGQPKKTAAITAPDQELLDHADGPDSAIPLQIISPDASDHHPIRLLLIILAAAALTLGVLWWMTPANPWGR